VGEELREIEAGTPEHKERVREHKEINRRSRERQPIQRAKAAYGAAKKAAGAAKKAAGYLVKVYKKKDSRVIRGRQSTGRTIQPQRSFGGFGPSVGYPSISMSPRVRAPNINAMSPRVRAPNVNAIGPGNLLFGKKRR